MDYSKIASISGKTGLFKVISPTRLGVVLESLDVQKKRMVAGIHHKLSVLSKISIYTTDAVVPMEEVMRKIHKEFQGDIDLNKNSDTEELKSFMRFILPNYDEKKVYVSDIRRLVSWYIQLVKEAPEMLIEPEEAIESETKDKQDDL